MVSHKGGIYGKDGGFSVSWLVQVGLKLPLDAWVNSSGAKPFIITVSTMAENLMLMQKD